MSLDNAAHILVIANLVQAKFVAANIEHSFEQPNVNSVRKIERSIAKVVTSFPTTLFGGRFGHLSLALIQDNMRRITGDLSLDCRYPDNPDQVNPDIEDSKAGRVLLAKQEDQKKALAAWHLCDVFNEVGFKHMSAAFELRYTEALDLKYLGMKK